MNIQDIYNHSRTRQLSLELASFINTFNCLDSNFEIFPHYEFDEERLDGDRIKIYEHLYKYIDGIRYVDIRSVEFDGHKIGLVGKAGRDGRDEHFSYITNVDAFIKCYTFLINEVLKDYHFNETDPCKDIGSDKFYGQSIKSHYSK